MNQILVMYLRKVRCGNFAIYEGDDPKGPFVQTPYEEWLWIKDRRKRIVESERRLREVLFCQVITYDEMIQHNDGTAPPHVSTGEHIPEVECIYGRCEASMRYLDAINREYVNTLEFKKGDILAIKSVAGSGKTTTLLNLAAAHSKKRILYLAFNKSLIEEMKQKAPPNLQPRTFDSLLYNTITPRPTNLMDVKAHTISKIVPLLREKPWRMRQKYVNLFNRFCEQVEFDSPEMFTNEKPEKILFYMWEKAVERRFHTFGTIRKICHDRRFCRDVIDNQYDMIFIDESQDFDKLMLSILLRDTTIPKIFVGDPLQAIYQWRGAIDAFDYLPRHTKVIEFYTSFRVGEPACSQIRKRFDNCWMISGKEHETLITPYETPDKKYTYLFRSWKGLLETARYTKNIWINDFKKQSKFIRQLSERLKRYNLTEEERAEFSDDLPTFLLSLEPKDLDDLLNTIEANMVPRKSCTCEMYTIHAYKGLEDDIVKVHNDINLDKDNNIYYVALTRGKVRVIV